MSAYVSAYVSIRVSIRQHTSAYVSIRQHTSAYVSIRQHTDAPARAERTASPGYAPTSPTFDFMRPIYRDAIHKVAAQLSSNITKDSDADSVRFDNGFEILNRSKYLIKWYIEELNKNPVPFSYEGDIEAGVIGQMGLEQNFNDNGSWALYLEAFDADSETQSKDLELMRLHQTPEDESETQDTPSDATLTKRKREQEGNLERLKAIRHGEASAHALRQPPPPSLTAEIRLLLTRLALYSRDE